MGLDMYAYVSAKADQMAEYWNRSVDNDEQPPREIAYWRKHPNLHGWMERLWKEKVGEETAAHNSFNGIELELTWEDLDQLEADITNNGLPYTEGFFFGSPADDYYRDTDLKFIREAKAELFLGLRVFYNSSW